MRINPKLFDFPGEDQAFEVQEFDDRKIELFFMNDYEPILNDCISKGKFSTWSSVDGHNYRLFLEKGFYEELAPLYSAKINKIWVEFWDVTEKVSKKYTRFGTLPIGVLAIILCLVSGLIETYGTYIALGGIAIAFIGMVLINGKIRKKIDEANVNSRALIVKELGEEQFNALLEKQKEYMDTYYANLYPDEEETQTEAEVLDAPKEDEVQEEAQEEKPVEAEEKAEE